MKNYRLPESCYAHDLESGKTVLIVNGTDIRLEMHGVNVNLANSMLGITPPQREAMLIGSHFGWDTPGADPDLYNPDGTINKEAMLKLIDRLQAAITI